ncbi:hypothetical protein EPJ69_03635 [Brachyspira aalborgi]|uniref:Uncharacterized protein n=1 Tax=Brachyspira aalborgi TaxID=29522 RepID=A0A5C8E8A3_9SPIR|nr:hypothetical protein [Brachyspira aalborgi]TXJ33863.1 hypothetical protein EPJ69_03635 [Brachyspira aalborgi]
MLSKEEKNKIEEHIAKLTNDILSDAINSVNSGVSEKKIIDDCIMYTISKFTPESKMLLSSVYNMLMERTLKEEFFTNSHNKASFYEMNIFKELNEKFNFEIPSKIEYEKSERKINEWIKAGIITIIGGVISISLKKASPIIVAFVIAGIMTVINKNKENNKKEDLTALVKEYLESIKQSILSWVDSIAEYYDERVNELKKELENKNK